MEKDRLCITMNTKINKKKENVMNVVVGEIIGYLSGTCTMLAFLPQAIKSITTKNVSGLSMYMYIIYCMGLVFWILYGIYLHSFQIMLFNSITLIFNVIILYMIIKSNLKNKKK